MENIKSLLKYPEKANLYDPCKRRESTLMAFTAHIFPTWHQAAGELVGIHQMGQEALRHHHEEGLSPLQGAHTELSKLRQPPPFPKESWFQSPSACRLAGAKQPQNSVHTKTNLGCILLLFFGVISSNEINKKWCGQQFLHFTNKAYILLGNFCYPALSWKC